MIIQGSNEPIYLIFDDVNDLPIDIAISLRNELTEFKHWGMGDITVEDMTYIAPISQAESLNWPEGPCVVEAKWMDSYGNTIFMPVRTRIARWDDKTILSEG